MSVLKSILVASVLSVFSVSAAIAAPTTVTLNCSIADSSQSEYPSIKERQKKMPPRTRSQTPTNYELPKRAPKPHISTIPLSEQLG